MSRNEDTRVRLSAEGIEEVIKAYRRIQEEAVKTRKIAEQNPIPTFGGGSKFGISPAFEGSKAASPPIVTGLNKVTVAAGKGAESLGVMAAAGQSLFHSLTGIALAGGAAGITAGIVTVGFQAAANAIGSVVSELDSLISGQLEAADSMGKLSQKTGQSVETLSVWSSAARTADVSQEALTSGLRGFNRVMGAYNEGAQDAVDSTEQLFHSRKAFDGLNDGQRLQKTVDALAAMGDTSERSALSLKFFGKSGSELLPLINSLGGSGFARAREEAEKLGLVFDKNMAQAAERARDSWTRLKLASEGLANQIAIGLAPALARVGEGLNDAFAGKGVKGMERFGKIAGSVLEHVALRLVVFELEVEQFAKTIKALSMLDFSEFSKKLAQNRIDTALAIKAFLFPVGGGSSAGGEDDDGDSFERKLDARRKAVKARLAQDQSQLQNELSFHQAELSLRNAQEKASFEKNQADVRGHFERRRQMAEDQSAIEIEILRKQEALIKAETADDEAAKIEKQQKLADVWNKINIREIALQKELIELTGEERSAFERAFAAHADEIEAQLASIDAEAKAQAESAALRRQIESDILDLQGNRHDKAMRDIDDEARRVADALKESGFKREEIEELVARLKTAKLEQFTKTESAALVEFNRKALEAQGERFKAQRLALSEEAKQLDDELLSKGLKDPNERALKVGGIVNPKAARIDFDEARDAADNALRDLQRERDTIQNDVATGKIFQIQADQRILDIENQRIPALREIATQMQAAASASFDQEAIQQAQDFSAAIEQVAIHTDAAGRSMAQLKASIEDAADNALTEFFTTGIDNAESFGDAFRTMTAGVISDIRRIIAEMLVAQLRAKVIGAAIGLFGFGGGGGGVPGAGAQIHAAGGLVSGPGTGTSDSIPAWLSDGEYVVNARAVKHWGLEFLRGVNTMNWRPRSSFSAPRFADGGLVSASAESAGKGFDGTLNIGLSEGLIGEILESPQAGRILIKHAAKNRKAWKAVLG